MCGQRFEELPAFAFLLEYRAFFTHVDGFVLRLRRIFDRARRDAQSATRAVVDGDLQRVSARAFFAAALESYRFERGRRSLEQRIVIALHADDGMRADDLAVAALRADLGLPDRHLIGQIFDFPGRGARRIRTVGREHASRQLVAFARDHRTKDVANELGRAVDNGGGHVEATSDLTGHVDAMQIRECAVDGRVVHLDDLFAFADERAVDGLFDLLDRFVLRQHAGNGKETRLHDRADASAQACFARNAVAVADPELDFFFDDLLLHLPW